MRVTGTRVAVRTPAASVGLAVVRTTVGWGVGATVVGGVGDATAEPVRVGEAPGRVGDVLWVGTGEGVGRGVGDGVGVGGSVGSGVGSGIASATSAAAEASTLGRSGASGVFGCALT